MKKFVNPFDPENERIKIVLENWVKNIQFLNDNATVVIHEQVCTEPACVFSETIITVEQEDTRKTFIIAKPLTFIREPDIRTMREITFKKEFKHAH